MTSNKALVAVDRASFPILAQPDAALAVRRAVEEYGADFGSLTRIRLPSGGQIAWSIPSATGEDEIVKEFAGVIASVKMNEKAWWREPLGEGGGGSPPDCSSHDGIMGFGINTLEDGAMPGEHECRTCPWNSFGSARGVGARGKDCADLGLVFVFRQGSRLPSVLVVPPSSLKTLQRYCIGMVDQGLEAWRVVTRFGLEKKQNQRGIDYAMLKLAVARPLDEEETAAMTAVCDAVRDMASRLRPGTTVVE